MRNATCHRAKFWLSVWKDCGCPRSGIINSIRLTTKRRFSKELSLHRKSLVDCYSTRANRIEIFFSSLYLWQSLPLCCPRQKSLSLTGILIMRVNLLLLTPSWKTCTRENWMSSLISFRTVILLSV